MNTLNVDKLKEQAGCNTPADEAQIRICNLKLKQNNLPEIPTDYAELLKIANGFSNENAWVFGADIKNNNWYKDIADFNIDYFHGQPAKWLILGEDDFLYFIYDAERKVYCIADRDDFEEETSSDEFDLPLAYILRLE